MPSIKKAAVGETLRAKLAATTPEVGPVPEIVDPLFASARSLEGLSPWRHKREDGTGAAPDWWPDGAIG